MNEAIRAHVIAGGFPPGKPAGHDHDYARLRILEQLKERDHVHTSVSGDYTDIEKWLPECRLLVTYVAGPFADEHGNTVLRQWLEAGGRWLALHGSSGGKAVRRPDTSKREMVEMPYHETLGGFFLSHPPIRKFRVDLVDAQHPLTRGLPESFETIDEPYMVELQAPERSQLLLSADWGEVAARMRRPASTSSATRPCSRTAAARVVRSPSCASSARARSPTRRSGTATRRRRTASASCTRTSRPTASHRSSSSAHGRPRASARCCATASPGVWARTNHGPAS